MFPFTKAFKKQIETVEDQGEIQNQGQVNKYTYDHEDNPLMSKQKGIFDKLVDERPDEITKLDEQVNHNDLIYRYKGETLD